jgi:hypothetical protein
MKMLVYELYKLLTIIIFWPFTNFYSYFCHYFSSILPSPAVFVSRFSIENPPGCRSLIYPPSSNDFHKYFSFCPQSSLRDYLANLRFFFLDELPALTSTIFSNTIKIDFSRQISSKGVSLRIRLLM